MYLIQRIRDGKYMTCFNTFEWTDDPFHFQLFKSPELCRNKMKWHPANTVQIRKCRIVIDPQFLLW